MSLGLLLVVALALFSLAFASTARAQGDPAQLLASGRQAYEAGDYEKARTDLWAYLEATGSLTGASRLPQAEALFYIARMEPDAAVAAQHYQTIVDEYPAASVADEALFRLGVYALVTGQPEEGRGRFLELKQNYPFSRYQGEIPMWIGRTFLAEGRHQAATDALIEGFSRVRMQELPYEMTAPQRDALAADYVYWLARAFHEEGDERTAIQYWSLLALDYASSPQAAEARAALAAAGRPVAEPVARARPPEEPPVEAPPAVVTAPPREVPPAIAEAPPPREAPPAVVEAPPPREAPTAVVRVPPRAETPSAPPRPAPQEPRPQPAAPAAQEAPKFPPPAAAAGTVWLQVGAFGSATRAAELSKRLKADGFPSQVEVGIVNGQGFYRVRVGPYRLPSESEALRATEERLGRMGYPTQRVAIGS